MGNFYTNYTLRGPTPQAIAAAMEGRSAVISPVSEDCVVVFDEASEAQDMELISGLAAYLSVELHCPLLAALNHDDSFLWYQLYRDGELVDEYNSSPDYFEDVEQGAPTGGDAQTLCRTFGTGKAEEVERVLRSSTLGEGGYVFASERHADLLAALEICTFGAGGGFENISNGELPEGLDPSALLRLQGGEPDRPLDVGASAIAPGYFKLNLHAVNPKLPAGKSLPVGWMPGLWADLECSELELSQSCLLALATYRKHFRQLGFGELGFKKVRGLLNPSYKDSGGVNFLAANRSIFGQLLYRKTYLAAQNEEREAVVVAFSAVFSNGTLSSTNNRDAALESLPNHEILRVDSNDVEVIFKRLAEHPRLALEKPRVFSDERSLQAWFDSNALQLFEDRVRRGIFTRMSRFEVFAARRKMDSLGD